MKYLLTYLKGMAMGAADVVPGVSGGTIAFITGILDTLLESIRRINPNLIKLVRQQGIKAAFDHINGPFLLAVFHLSFGGSSNSCVVIFLWSDHYLCGAYVKAGARL